MHDQILFQQAAAMVLTFEQHLPKTRNVSESHVNLYHENIELIENATHYDLDHFRIPPCDMRPNTTTRSEPTGVDHFGIRRGTRFVQVPTGGNHCPYSLFVIRLQGLVNFLKMQTAPEELAAVKKIGF